MFDLDKRELYIMIFLISSIIVALGFSAYKRSQEMVTVEIKRFESERGPDMQNLDEVIRKESIININEANPEDLMKLKGVGRVLAGRIISYRSSSGRFRSVSEIQNVKGLGKKLFDDIKDYISIE